MFKDVELFKDLPEEGQQTLAKHATTRTFKRNTIVMSAGDQTNSLYVVESGRVRIYLDDARGHEITLRTIGPGGSFGELAMLSEGPRAANVVTLEESRLSVISKNDFMQCLHSNPAVSFMIIRSLVERIREMTEDVSTLALLDVYGRVAKTLMRHSTECDGKRLTEPMTHQDIANLVGSSREMISRILKDLRTGGYVSVKDKQLILEKPLPSGW
ncbi:MAG: Crp/Fnr family transcriptional regulator [Pseudomonadales bacterium]